MHFIFPSGKCNKHVTCPETCSSVSAQCFLICVRNMTVIYNYVRFPTDRRLSRRPCNNKQFSERSCKKSSSRTSCHSDSTLPSRQKCPFLKYWIINPVHICSNKRGCWCRCCWCRCFCSYSCVIVQKKIHYLVRQASFFDYAQGRKTIQK